MPSARACAGTLLDAEAPVRVSTARCERGLPEFFGRVARGAQRPSARLSPEAPLICECKGRVHPSKCATNMTLQAYKLTASCFKLSRQCCHIRALHCADLVEFRWSTKALSSCWVGCYLVLRHITMGQVRAPQASRPRQRTSSWPWHLCPEPPCC